ncbi:MAG: EAL domain-containing protein [Bacteroides sp.]|nr:EAL domain-containing protein [Prevotella sp.]MCM1408065.1 EAL domain-containing protein [Treponema brennaborense]MCM1469041.1 EAL domain-containing protein [Bacteroides sp.]
MKQLANTNPAYIDNLTGIYNREGFQIRVQALFKENPETQFVLLRGDISRFRVINDMFGAETGDKLLKSIAEEIAEYLPENGACARMHGDNFVIFYPENLLDIEQMMQKLDALLARTFPSYPIKVYVGIYYITNPAMPVDLMCDRAKLALETVKGNYIHNYAVYDDTIRSKLMEEQQIVAEMETGLAQGQFFVEYQPIFSATTNEPVSAEALVRWKHPKKGIINPGIFIPLFEKNGFVTKLDFYVWEQVCKFLHEELEAGHHVIPISVNVSRRNFFNTDLCNKLLELTGKYHIDTSLLKLEITESAYTDNPVLLENILLNLQTHGFKILMDDFGSGYSSLNMLKDIPVDILKIDMNFIREIETSERAANILNSVVRMAKWLSMNIVAEGIETRKQLEFLRSIGCDCIQGFYFSKPLPEKTYSSLINSGIKEKATDEIIREEDIAKDFDVFWTANSTTNFLMNSMIGAMCIFEFSGDSIELLRANEAYIKLMGGSDLNVFPSNRNILSSIQEEDRRKILDACTEAQTTKELRQIIVRSGSPSKIIWLEIKIKYIGKTSRSALYYAALTDITNQKDFEQKNALYRYTTIFRGFFGTISELDYTDNTAHLILFNTHSLYQETNVRDLDEAMAEMCEIIHPDDRQRFLECTKLENLKAATAKNGEMTLELRVKRKDGNYHKTVHIYVPENNPDGKNIFMVFTKKDL